MRCFPARLRASRRAFDPVLVSRLALALLAAAGAGLAVPAQAGRPLATDDAALVEPGACQLELWQEHGRGRRALWAQPGCTPFGRTELSIGAARVRDDGERATVSAWQVKQLLRETGERTGGYALALRTEHDWRVHGDSPAWQGDTALTGIASWPLAGQALLLHANLGLLRKRESGSDSRRARTRGTWATAFDAGVTPATRVSLEVHGSGGERASWQAGWRRELREGLQLDFACGARAGRWSATRQASVGLVVVTPPLR